MKKWTSWVLALLMIVSVGFVSGCQKSATSAKTNATNATSTDKAKHIPKSLGKGLENAMQKEKGTTSQPANGATPDTNTAQPKQ